VQRLVLPWESYLHRIKELKPAKISEQSNDLADNLKGKFTDLVDGVKEKFSNAKAEAEDVAEKGYSAYNRKKAEFNT